MSQFGHDPVRQADVPVTNSTRKHTNHTAQTSPHTHKAKDPLYEERSNNGNPHPSLSTDEQLRDYRDKHRAHRASMNFASQVTNQYHEFIDVLIVGDSMTKAIKPTRLSKSRCIRCKTLPGAKIETASDIVLSLASILSPNEVILHLGTNNIMHDDSHEIVAKISSLANEIMENSPSTRITISTIIHRQSESPGVYQKVNDVNNELKLIANQRSWSIIANDNISTDAHIAIDGVHLNGDGTRVFASNFIAHLRNERQPVYSVPYQTSFSYREADTRRQHPHAYSDALNDTNDHVSHFRAGRQRKKPKGRIFPRDWLDSLQTAHRLLNNKQ